MIAENVKFALYFQLEKHFKWRVGYSTDTTEDHEIYEVTALGGKRYNVVTKKVL